MTPLRIRWGAGVLAALAGCALLAVGVFFGPSPAGNARTAATRRPNPTHHSSAATPGHLAATSTMPPPIAPSPTAPPPTVAVPTEAEVPAGEITAVEPTARFDPPAGAGATSDPATCTWDRADGGTLRASGTLTNTANDEDAWLVSINWYDGRGLLDRESDFFEAGTGQSVAWSLTVSDADAPTGALRCGVQLV